MTSWSKRRLSVRARRIAPSGGWWQPENRRSPSRCLGDVLLVFAALLAVMPAPARAQGTAPSATYRVTFEGTWTSSVTPGGVISSAHFSPLIGAVHDGGVIFWSRGGTASAGIEEVAETGRTATFRSEINASPNAVTVVEQGLPNGPTPTATVEFTVTTDHPLVTLVAMIAPSPDWFVGVSGLSLRDARGQWRARQQVDLFPYDAGTEEGTEFALDNPATSPQETITSIRGTGKFSNEPIARLTFELQSPVAPASITLSVDPERVLEGAGATPVTVTASLDGSVRTEDTAVTVTVSGSGAAGVVGFAAVAAFDVTISAGAAQGTGTFTVTPEDDAVDEMDERIDVRGTSSLEVRAATLILVDDDDPPASITLSVDPERVLEGAGATPVTVTASLDGSVRTEDTAVTVSVSGSGAAGVVGFAAVAAFDVTIAAGAAQGTGTFTVTPEDDAVDEMDERIDVRGTSSLEVRAAALILVDDDDPPASITLSVDPERVLEGAGATPVTVTASLDGSVRTEDTAVTVSVSGSGAAGVVGFAAVAAFDVTIAAGAAQGTGTFTVTPEDDAVDEMDERIDVRGTSSLEVRAATLILVDDDDPPASITLSVDPERVLEGAGATPVTVTASLDGSVRTEDTAVTVSVSGSGAPGVVGFGAVAAFKVTIPAAASSGTGTFTVTPEDDAVDEMDERVDVRGESTLVVQPAALILADDDDPSTSIVLSLDREQVAEDAGATPVTVTATLGQSARTEDTVVMVSVSGSGAPGVVGFGAVAAFKVTIPAAASSGTGTFTVTPEDDAVDEMDERVDVRGESTLVVQPAALILADDDDPSTSIVLSLDREQVAEDAGATPVTVTATLGQSARTEDTVVMVSVSGSGAPGVVDFGAVEAFEVTIPAAASSGTGTFTVTPEDDAVDEMDERVDVRGESTLVVQPAALILADDDDPSTSIVLSLDRERMAEDAGVATVAVTATLDQSARTEDTVVTVAVSGSGGSGVVGFEAVEAFEVTIPATMVSGAGTFALTPLNDMAAAGDETVRVSGASALPVTAATLILTDDDDASVATAWLARFGRTSASHVVDAVAERLRGAPSRRTHVTAGGQRLFGGSGGDGGLATLAQGLFGAAVPAGGGSSMGGLALGGQRLFGTAGRAGPRPAGGIAMGATPLSVQTVGALGSDAHGRALPGAALSWDRFRSMRGRDLLSQSSFYTSSAQVADSGDAAGRGARWAAWGRGAVTRFDGGEGALSIDGDIVTGTAGVDYARGRLLAGLAVAHTVGDGRFVAPGVGEAAANAGELGSSLTSGHPYLGFAVSERLSLWGVFGYGQGEMSLSDGDALTETDIAMRMGAVGLRRELLSGPGGFDLAVNSDLFLVRMTSDAVAGQAAVVANATRLRVAMETGFGWTLASGGVVTPSLEVGVRYDDGDAERGTGVELGGGVRFADAARGLTMEASARTLLVHEASSFREWGAGGSLLVDPGAAGQGLSLGLRSSIGPTASGAERLWSQRDLATLVGPGRGPVGQAGRLEAELRYGLRVSGSRARLSPYGALSRAEGVQAYGVGSRVDFGQSFSVSLEASRFEHVGGAPYHGVLVRGHLLK